MIIVKPKTRAIVFVLIILSIWIFMMIKSQYDLTKTEEMLKEIVPIAMDDLGSNREVLYITENIICFYNTANDIATCIY